MKGKKLLSAFAALAMTVSAFAGLAVTADAAWSATQIYSNDGGSAKNNTSTVDIGSALTEVSTGNIRIGYTVTTNVDYANTSGDRNGTVTLVGKNSSNEELILLSIYANTDKNGSGRRYALGGVADASSTVLDLSKDNTTSHEFDVELNINLDTNKMSGTISKMDAVPQVTMIEEITCDLDSLEKIDIKSISDANTMSVKNFKVYTLTEAAGYVLKTTPYSKVTVGEKAYYSIADGTVNFRDDAVNEGASVTIEKNGYTTKNITADVTNGNTVNLSLADNSVSYYEDFEYVTDNFGFNTNASVSNGVMYLEYTPSDSPSTSFASSIGVAGKDIHIKTKAENASKNHYGYIKFGGTNLQLYFYDKTVRLEGNSKSRTDFVNCADYVDLDIVISDTGKKASFYSNGKYIADISCEASDFSGLAASGGKGTSKIYIDTLEVKNSPATSTITIKDDGTEKATKYITGTTITLPEAVSASKPGYTFKNWKDGNGTTYTANASVTVNADLTFTAEYDITKSIEVLPVTSADLTEDLTVTDAADDETTKTIPAGTTLYTFWVKTVNCTEGAPSISISDYVSGKLGEAQITKATLGTDGSTNADYYCVQVSAEGLDNTTYTATFKKDGVEKSVDFKVEIKTDVPEIEI